MGRADDIINKLKAFSDAIRDETGLIEDHDIDSIPQNVDDIKHQTIDLYLESHKDDYAKAAKIIRFNNFNTRIFDTAAGMFEGYIRLTSLIAEYFDTHGVTDMSRMFKHCLVLQRLAFSDYRNFSTENVRSFQEMFSECESLSDLNLTTFNTSNCRDMSYMFNGCKSLINTSFVSFDTRQVVTMDHMFNGCSSYVYYDLAYFETKNCINMAYMFAGSTKAEGFNLDFFNTLNVTNMQHMFENCTTVQELDLTSFKTPIVMLTDHMFNNCTGLKTLLLPNFTIDEVEDTQYMFGNCSSLENLDLSSFHGSKLIVTAYMFSGCESMTELLIPNFFTENVIDMRYMFNDCASLENLDLSSFDTYGTTMMKCMFRNCKNLSNLNIDSFDTSLTVDMSGMFYNCNNVTTLDHKPLDLSCAYTVASMYKNCLKLKTLDMSECIPSDFLLDVYMLFKNCLALETFILPEVVHVYDMGAMFDECRSLQTIDITPLDTSEATDFAVVFYNNNHLNNIIGLDHLDTAKVTRMTWMFYNCLALSSIDISTFDVSNLTTLHEMFKGCTSLSYVNLHFENAPTKLTNCTGMFANCITLRTIDISPIMGPALTYMCSMFDGCSNLVSIDLTAFDFNIVDYIQFMFCNCTSLVHVDMPDVSKSEISAWSLFDGCSSLPSIDLSRCDIRMAVGMFNKCSSLSEIIFHQETRCNSHITCLFYGCESLRGTFDLTMFDTSNVVNIEGMFAECVNIEHIDVSSFVTSNVLYMACVFKNCASLRSIDLTNWDFTKVIAMGGMFWGCNSLESIEFPDAVMFNMTNSNGGSRQLKQLDGTYSGRTYSTYTQNKSARVGHGFAFNRNDPDGIFKNDDLIVGTKPIDYIREFQSEDTHLSFDRNNLSHMFDGCYVLRSIDVHNFTTHYVKTMAYMFNDCRTLEYIDLRAFDTYSVLDMTHMFADCWSLEKIDIKTETIESITTKFTVPKCTDFSYMFYNCKSMKELVLDCFLTTSGQYYEHMFDGCTAITEIKIDSFNMIQALNISYMFRNCESLKFLDLSQFATRRVNNMGHIFENIGVNVHPCYKVRIFIPQGFLANNVPNDPEKTPFEYPGRLYDNEGVDVYTDVLEKDVNKQYWRNRNKNFRFHWGYQYSNFVNLRDGTPAMQRCFTGKVKHENVVYAPQYAGEYREWKDMDMGIRLKRIESKMHNGVSGGKAISGEVEGDTI